MTDLSAPPAPRTDDGATSVHRVGQLFGFVRSYAPPVLMAVVFVLASAFTVSRLDRLATWSATYDGSGQHVVWGCEPMEVRGGSHWVCDGVLVVDGSPTEVRVDLVTSMDALVSERPYVGQRHDVIFDPDRLGTVHPEATRLNELARLYLSLLPRLLTAAGAGMWLAGWALTRRIDTTDLVVQDGVRFPGRFGWRSRGQRWILAAAVLLGLNHLLTTRVIGSLGTF